MPAFSASAPAKIILFGEHAVVYGRPAIAVPVDRVKARAVVSADPRRAPGHLRILAPDVNFEAVLGDLPEDHPLACAVHGVLAALQIFRPPACTIKITSTIPVAAGMGSGAAVSVAVIRALSAFLGRPMPDERVSALAFEVEKLHHGTPSGIDNSVVTFARPVYFVKGQPVETFHVPRPFTIVIGDTGVTSPTSIAVSDLRRSWNADQARYEPLFDAIGRIARSARQSIEIGQPYALGPLMNENQALLVQMSVSSFELDRLIAAARSAGALGAKLSGGGRGGNMIALATPEMAAEIARALHAAGAIRTIVTEIQ